ncbi:MAG: FtsX-like permease family protein, partial [Proteobacteria bacterium]|nr:FtsX-like permease family protein [Pseudomonadota bacterium]
VAKAGWYWQPALLAALFGWLTALVFALWPLASAQEVPAAGLFRDIVQPARRWPRPIYLAAIALAAAGLAGLTIFGAGQPLISRWFVLGAVGSLLAFRVLAWLIVRVVRGVGRVRNPTLRLALTNICRPGAPTGGIVVSLGAGLTVLVAVALIQSNLTRQVTERIPLDAPAFFFIDIQPDQRDAFATTVASVAGAGGVVQVPMLRGRVTRVNGTPVANVRPDPDAAWVLRGEIGFTYAGLPPEGTDLRLGEWWPVDYAGPPLVSLDIDIARGLGVAIGDTMTYSILGREITAQIKNLRKSDWMNLGINFVTVFAPGTLEGAPQSLLATAPAAEEAVFRAVTDRFPNISPIRVRSISERIASFFRQVGAGVQAASAIALLTGVLVLAGAVAAGHRRRVYDAVVLKVLGATRGYLVRAFLLEYVLLGLSTAIIAVGVGSLAGWVVVTEVMRAEWEFLPGTALLTVIGGALLTALFGFAGVWLALGQKPAPILRAE